MPPLTRPKQPPMNTAFTHYSARNKHRPYCLVVRNIRGQFDRVSGWFSTEKALLKFKQKMNAESTAFFAR